MTAAEAIKLNSEYCSGRACDDCAFYDLNNGRGIECYELQRQYPEDVVRILEDWKNEKTVKNSNQEAKRDEGKPRLSLVPQQIIWDIARVREYGNKKYHDPDNWKTVEIERYRDALYRHFLAYLKDPKSVDEESGIPHYMHMACNMAFICEMEA